MKPEFIWCSDHPGLLEFGAVNLLGIEPTAATVAARWPWWLRDFEDHMRDPPQAIVPFTVPAGRDLVVRYLAEGERCPGIEVEPGVWSGCDPSRRNPKADPDCPTCLDEGYTRKPHDCAWARDLDEGKPLAECLRLVTAGEQPLKGVLGPWSLEGTMWRRKGKTRGWSEVRTKAHPDRYGWVVCSADGSDPMTGHETGEEGKRLADEAARANGLWLLESTP